MKRFHTDKQIHQNRRGIAVLWLVIWGSMFLTFFCGVLEIATMWQAHVEIRNTLDAAALAAVKEWGDEIAAIPPLPAPPPAYTTGTPRDVGIAYATANPVLGSVVTLTDNRNPANTPNENATATGNFIFGGLDGITAPIAFNAGTDVTAGIPAVRAQATVPVQGFCSAIFGVTLLNVSATSTAYYDNGSNQAALVSVATYTGP